MMYIVRTISYRSVVVSATFDADRNNMGQNGDFEFADKTDSLEVVVHWFQVAAEAATENIQ
jgi:hypothetical protein